MHEWALAKDVISTSLKVAEGKNVKEIVKIKIKVGELQQIDEDVFESALKELAKGTLAEGARIEIEPERAIFECRACGREWTFSDSREKLGSEKSEAIHLFPALAQIFICCPKCGSQDFEIKKGREVWVDSIQIKES